MNSLRILGKIKREQERIISAITATRCITLSDLGNDKPKGGTAANMKNRFAVLDRIRSVSALTPAQATTWHAFKEMWDERRKNALGHKWGKTFAEETKQILDDVQRGFPDALSRWMEDERLRILPDAQCLFLPAIEFK